MKKFDWTLKMVVTFWGAFLILIFTILWINIDNKNSYIVEEETPSPIPTPNLNIEIKKTGTNSVQSINEESFYSLSDYERWLVESIVCGEAGIEPYWGKVAVASCILNACLLEDKRPEEIQTMYGYAGWKPIEEFESECMEAYGNTDLADEVREAVSQVFDMGEVYSNEILWFCSGYSSWHESQRFVFEIGGHKFFGKWD